MYRPGLLFTLLLISSPARAQEPAPKAPDKAPGKAAQETWHAAYFEGVKAGHVHTLIEPLERDGATVLRCTRVLELRVRRYKEVVPLRLETVSEEKEDGHVVGLGMTQFLDKGGKLAMTGTVDGAKLNIKVGGSERRVPWNDECLGMIAQDRLYQARKVKPGDAISFLSYELSLLAPLTIRAVVKEPETVDTLAVLKDGKVTRSAARLTRVELTSDKVDVGGTKVQLPGQVTWLDKDLLPVRHEWEFPGLGKVTLYQTTKEVAVKEGAAPELLPDLGLNTLVTVKTTLERPYDTSEVVYRIRVKGIDDATTAFARDARQTVRNVKGDTLELVVKAAGERADKPDEAEFLASSYFLDSDDARVKALAARAVGSETGALEKARKIERWVHDNMKPSNAVGFATASQVARDLAGDCRQHAMLTAALCRAARIPSRTAVGLIYAREPGRSPLFIFHMWTEVLVDGRWHGLDATLGRGNLSACHLKVADSSWRDTQTLAPLLPVSRLLGRLSIDILESR